MTGRFQKQAERARRLETGSRPVAPIDFERAAIIRRG
jgi:hypothetical protein